MQAGVKPTAILGGSDFLDTISLEVQPQRSNLRAVSRRSIASNHKPLAIKYL
jgi:hypothetical protein